MSYDHADDARHEAKRFIDALSSADRAALAADLATRQPARSQPITIKPDKWERYADRLPIRPDPATITRGAVIELAAEVLTGTRPVEHLFTTSYAWGWGPAGYAVFRHDAIPGAAIGTALRATLGGVLTTLEHEGPIAAYEALFGGTQQRDRRRAGSPGTARIHNYAAAFFTKFLYSAGAALTDLGRWQHPHAPLILDLNLARAIAHRTGMPHLVTGKPPRERAGPWSSYRYAIYLEWMAQTATELGTRPDQLEYSLFTLPTAARALG